MDKKELVSFKGMVDGVRINLADEAGIFDILTELEKKIQESKAFFGDGDCHISFGGRYLSSADKERLEELSKKLLPLCRVSFDQQKAKQAENADWILAYKEKDVQAAADDVNTQEPVNDTEFISMLRSNRARLYQGIVKPGLTLRSDGHLVLLGTVSEGASLIATGNIIVIGGLYGTAHAGCNGHNGSYIIAMDMRPEGLKIAQTAEEYVYDTEEASEPQTDDEKKSFFEKLRKRPEPAEIKQADKTEYSAVALLKNNKIELDNFTIQDFTNLKNMV